MTPPAQPNILLITDDQHRWDFLDNDALPGLRLPAIARLRAQGTTLLNGFSNCPICMPTRFTWLYGLYASQAAERLMRNAHDWPHHLPSMAHALQANGYHTALVGKLHSLAGLASRDIVAGAPETRARGFDDVFETSGKSLAYWYDCQYTRHLHARGLLDTYRADVATRCVQLGGHERYEPSPLAPDDHMDGVIGHAALQWLEQYSDSRPFFLHVSFCGPHFPLDPPASYFDRHDPADMPPPEGVNDPARIRMWQKQRALYAGLLELVDDQLNAVLEALDKKPELAANTLILFTTDHGDMMGHHDRSGKSRAYDTSCRTPVIARWPGRVPAGASHPALVEAVDLPATILDAAGCTAGLPLAHWLPNTPGRSYWPCLTAASDRHRDWVYAEHAEPAWRMCRDAQWKYVFRPDDNDQLFDLAGDPWEQHNLADAPACARRVADMRAKLLKSMTACAAPNTTPLLMEDDTMNVSVICHGNVARSQVLQHYLAEYAKRNSLDIDLFSCGTAPIDAYPNVDLLLAEVEDELRRRGLNGPVRRDILDDKALQRLTRSDLILVADKARRQEVLDRLGDRAKAKDVKLFYEFIGEGERDFVDTYDASKGAQDPERFTGCFNELERIAKLAIEQLRRESEEDS